MASDSAASGVERPTASEGGERSPVIAPLTAGPTSAVARLTWHVTWAGEPAPAVAAGSATAQPPASEAVVAPAAASEMTGADAVQASTAVTEAGAVGIATSPVPPDIAREPGGRP